MFQLKGGKRALCTLLDATTNSYSNLVHASTPNVSHWIRLRSSSSTTTTTSLASAPSLQHQNFCRNASPSVSNIESARSRRKRFPIGFWKNISNQRAFLDHLAEQLGVKSFEDWYNITVTEVQARGGSGLLDLYSSSLKRALLTVYPDYPWQSELFDQKRSRRRRTPIQQPLDKNNNNNNNANNNVVDELGRSPEDASQMKPNSARYWASIENQRAMFDRIGQQLGVRTFTDWYSVTVVEVRALGGGPILRNHYNFSLKRALPIIYPEHRWEADKFGRSHREPEAVHEARQNHRRLFDEIGAKLLPSSKNSSSSSSSGCSSLSTIMSSAAAAAATANKSNLDEWYGISLKQVQRSDPKANTILSQFYGNSLYRALKAIYPEHSWEPWRFSGGVRSKTLSKMQATATVTAATTGAATTTATTTTAATTAATATTTTTTTTTTSATTDGHDLFINNFVKSIERQLSIKHLDEWYRISRKQLLQVGGYFSIIAKNGGLQEVLRRVYPEYPWEEERFHLKQGKKSCQRWLRVIVEKIFPNVDVVEDYLHPKLKFKDSGEMMCLDVYVPSLQLAFEFHGVQHFIDVPFFRRHSQYQAKDTEKAQACKDHGITLVIVPYWWERSEDSLIATIYERRPELFSSNPPKPDARPISLEITPDMKLYSTNFNTPVLLASTWTDQIDPTGWWMSEKLDGVRAYWDGKQLYSKSGKELHAPPEFTELLPKAHALDGELWGGRGQFQTIAKLGSSASHTAWPSVQYCVFDAPNVEGPYETRLEALRRDIIPSLSPCAQRRVRALETIRCEGREHLRTYLDQVVRGGGEGVMLREAGSIYQRGRSASLLKVKPRQDTEVRFLRKSKTNWSLICEQINGMHCVVSCDSQTYHHPPKEGAIITVTHDGYWKSGKLRYPYFLRERTDVLSWDEVVASSSSLSEQHTCEAVAAEEENI